MTYFYVWRIQNYSFADNNTITATSNLLLALENETEQVIRWFNNNNPIVNRDKSQDIVLDKTDTSVSHKLNNHDNDIEDLGKPKKLH